MLMSKPARSGLAAKAAAAIATISRPRLLACRIWIRVHEEGERGREQKRSANNERRLCADQLAEGIAVAAKPDATTKIAIPPSSRRRAPNRSASAPKLIRRLASTSG